MAKCLSVVALIPMKLVLLLLVQRASFLCPFIQGVVIWQVGAVLEHILLGFVYPLTFFLPTGVISFLFCL